jgi:methionyl-tRNA synthetase
MRRKQTALFPLCLAYLARARVVGRFADTVMFPSTLMGADPNYLLLHHVSCTEYLNYEGSKFSKCTLLYTRATLLGELAGHVTGLLLRATACSRVVAPLFSFVCAARGTGVFGDDAIKSGIPAEVWRYYMLYNRPELADTVFLWEVSTRAARRS